MQSPHSSAHNHGRYNKCAHEDRAVTEILPSFIHHQQLSIMIIISNKKKT